MHYTFILLLMSIHVYAEIYSQEEDLKKIYLYTMVVFMQQIDSQYEHYSLEGKNAPALWLELKKFHKEHIGFSKSKSDYKNSNTKLLEEILEYFSTEQQDTIKKHNILDVNTLAGQVLVYELIYKEHQNGSVYLLPNIKDEHQRLALAFNSAMMADTLIKKQNLWGDYLMLWSAMVQQHNKEFQSMMAKHIDNYNAELEYLLSE